MKSWADDNLASLCPVEEYMYRVVLPYMTQSRIHRKSVYLTGYNIFQDYNFSLPSDIFGAISTYLGKRYLCFFFSKLVGNFNLFTHLDISVTFVFLYLVENALQCILAPWYRSHRSLPWKLIWKVNNFNLAWLGGKSCRYKFVGLIFRYCEVCNWL